MSRIFSLRHAAPIACAMAVFSIGAANAQNAKPEDTYTKLDLTGTGSIKAAPDQLTASFRAQSRDNSAATAQQAVNKQVQKAAELAQKADGVTAAILHYSVSEIRGEKDKSAPSWAASQTMTFTAADGKTLLPLTGQLQANGLLLEGLEWSLSPEKQKTLQLEAEKAAVADLKKQAETLATSLGLHVVRFATVSVSGTPFPRPVFMSAMIARAEVAPAPAPPPSSTMETQTVRASANATVLLAP
ncbi:hypothetical protein AD948_02325 [Acetobacter senegalensis]|uniref:DUF541 domain-containing protein n=1 Tax=Acetobacter senegalensis TaxID=446692 RepID=A0A149U770_9PROT|nr:SIMPL domain-containing protein [Acetobacter senegalensis]KXV61274.1 hypothetical protein AD948_02325 [Acetobacter senegalensis]